jgi:tripartite-type tricarboxylate transporter receptor subunit TctC
MEEFLKAARENTLIGGLPSPGSTSHICGLVSVDKLGMKVNWIPYNGSGEVLAGIAGKHLDFGIISTNSAQAMVTAGKLRPLMGYAERADASFPDVPFPEKLGYKMTTMAAIRGFVAPPGTPAKVAKILSDAMFSTVDNPNFVAWTKKVKLEILPLSGSKYQEATNEQYETLEMYRKLFKNQ